MTLERELLEQFRVLAVLAHESHAYGLGEYGIRGFDRCVDVACERRREILRASIAMACAVDSFMRTLHFRGPPILGARGRPMRLAIEFEREVDGRWIADVPELPGVMAYGRTKREAGRNVRALAKRILAERRRSVDAKKAAAPPKGNRRSVSGSLAARPGADKRIVAQHEDVRHSRGVRAMGRSRRRPSSPAARRTK